MSTTEETTADAQPTPDADIPDAVDVDRWRRDRELYGEYRSLYRLSPSNEAAACETAAAVREAINKELYRENPRDWVIARLNKKHEEVRDGD